jgi:hypothetical protein
MLSRSSNGWSRTGGRSTQSSVSNDGKQRNVDCYNQALRLADISGTLRAHLIDQRYLLDAAILDTTPCRTSSSVKVILSSVMTTTGGSPGRTPTTSQPHTSPFTAKPSCSKKAFTCAYRDVSGHGSLDSPSSLESMAAALSRRLGVLARSLCARRSFGVHRLKPTTVATSAAYEWPAAG